MLHNQPDVQSMHSFDTQMRYWHHVRRWKNILCVFVVMAAWSPWQWF